MYQNALIFQVFLMTLITYSCFTVKYQLLVVMHVTESELTIYYFFTKLTYRFLL